MPRTPVPARRLQLAAALAVLALAAGAGCSKTPSSPDFDAIVITSITPAVGTPLAPGSTVAFSGNVSYSLVSASSGTIALIFEDQNGIVLNPTSQASVAIKGGDSFTTLADHLTVPATGVTQVQVIFAVLPTGANGTSTTAQVNYGVSS